MFEILPNWHPVFVHFSVALLTVSVVFHILVQLLRDSRVRNEMAVVADWSLWLGACFTVVTVVAGWFAYNSVTHDEPSHAAMTAHRNWGLATLAAFLVLAAWLAWNRWRNRARAGIVFVVLLAAAGAALASTAWRGGELVYRHGLGVLALPVTEMHADGQDHDHGQAAAPATPSAKPAKPGVHDHSTHAH
jgi:uncharacterized membrane protein